MFEKYKKIIIGVLIVALCFVVWAVFIKADPQGDQLLSTTGQTEVDPNGQKIIQSLNKIKSLNLDKEIFNNPILIRLEDNNETIELRDVGRENPFEPFNLTKIKNSTNTNSNLVQ